MKGGLADEGAEARELARMEEGESGIRRVSGRGVGAELCRPRSGTGSGGVGGGTQEGTRRRRSRGAAPAGRKEEGPRPSRRGGSGDDAGPAVPGGRLGKGPVRGWAGVLGGPGRPKGQSLGDGGPSWENRSCVEAGAGLG